MIRLNTLKLPLPMCLMILLLLPICYLGYLKSYSDDRLLLFFVLFIACTFAYIVYCGFAKPEMSVYGFLFLWCVFPKKGIPLSSVLGWLKETFNLPDIPEVSLYFILVFVLLLAIVVKIITNNKGWVIKEFKILYLLFLFLVISGLIVSLKLFYYSDNSFVTEPARSLIKLVHVFSALIFFSGCMMFIKIQKQIEIIFSLFILSLVLLATENILFNYFGLFPQLHYWAISDLGRFVSMTFASDTAVGVCTIIALCCFFYFVFSRRYYKLLFLMPFLISPLINGYDRAPLAGLLSAMLFFIYMVFRNSKYKMLIITFGPALLIAAFSGYGETLIDKTTSFLGGDVRPDYLSTDSLFTRMGAYLRCIDVFIYSFPFGVGAGVVRFYMASLDVPSNFLLSSVDLRASEFYDRIRFGAKVTGSHNLYLQYITEFGLVGVITIISIVCFILPRFKSFIKRAKVISQKNYDLFLAQVCCYSVIIGLAVFYFFQTTPEYYFLLLLFIYLIVLIPKLVDEGNTN